MPILILCLRYLPPSTIDDTLDVCDLIGYFEGLISVFPSSLMTASSGTFSEGNFANLLPKLTLIAILGPPLSRRAAFDEAVYKVYFSSIICWSLFMKFLIITDKI